MEKYLAIRWRFNKAAISLFQRSKVVISMHHNLGRAAIFLIGLITLFFAWQARNITLNYDFESFLPVGDPELEYYREFREAFENDNDFLLLALVHSPSVFDSAFLSRVHALTDTLTSYPLVESVVSPTHLKLPVFGPGGYFEVPVLRAHVPQRYTSDSARIFRDATLVGSLFSADGQSLALVLRHKQQITKPEADSLTQFIISRLELLDLPGYHLAGKAKAQGVYIDKMQGELLFFLGTSIVLVVLFLALAYKSWSGVVVPLVVVLLSVVWITGFMALMGKSLDILMVLLPTIMFVVGMSDVVHILTRYLEELRNGVPKLGAIKTTFREVGLATLLTSLTTAVGFFTLLTARIAPIREFGLYTGIGVFMAFIVAFTVMPATLLFVRPPQAARDLRNRMFWRKWLSIAFFLSLRKRKWALGISALLAVVSLWGISLLKVDTFLIEDLPSHDPLKQDFVFFDAHYGGSRPFEMTVEVQEGDIYEMEVLLAIEKVESFLRDTFEVGNLLTPATLIRSLHRARNGGAPEAAILPANADALAPLRAQLPRIERRWDTPLHTPDRKVGRISGRMGDFGSALSLERTYALERFLRDQIDPRVATFTLTGTSNLIDKNNLYLVDNMLQGLAIAFAVTALLAGLLFKSFRMVLITLVPNILPLLMVAGIMGWAGITLKLSTSIIFTIAFGIAVDDTIHFLSKLRLELSKGKSMLYAIKRTYFSTGKAIVVTSLILSGGFLTLVMSSFGGTFYTGLLVSLTLVFAVVIDLLVLPSLLLLGYKSKKSGTAP
jgi:uncharacterized protein